MCSHSVLGVCFRGQRSMPHVYWPPTLLQTGFLEERRPPVSRRTLPAFAPEPRALKLQPEGTIASSAYPLSHSLVPHFKSRSSQSNALGSASTHFWSLKISSPLAKFPLRVSVSSASLCGFPFALKLYSKPNILPLSLAFSMHE